MNLFEKAKRTTSLRLFKQIEKKDEGSGGVPEYIVAGLGNPGAKYHQTRHNAGFMALDYVYEKLSVTGEKSKFKSLVRDGSFRII